MGVECEMRIKGSGLECPVYRCKKNGLKKRELNMNYETGG